MHQYELTDPVNTTKSIQSFFQICHRGSLIRTFELNILDFCNVLFVVTKSKLFLRESERMKINFSLVKKYLRNI